MQNILFRLVYVWGYNGYCRLGLGNQIDELIPKVVPHVSRHTSHAFFFSLTYSRSLLAQISSLWGQELLLVLLTQS
jgi:hypothetical protein